MEAWARNCMKVHMGATLRKNADELKIATDRETGQPYYYRSKPIHVDYDGHFPMSLGGSSVAAPFVMEVKGFQGGFSLSQLKPRQMDILDVNRLIGKLSIVVLVEHEKGRILRGWFVPWVRHHSQPPNPRSIKEVAKGLGVHNVDTWWSIHENDIYIAQRGRPMSWSDLIEGLQVAAQEDKRFKGRSMRQKDQHLLESCLVEKVRGRWKMCGWLERMKPATHPSFL
jgi:hypothetical protein